MSSSFIVPSEEFVRSLFPSDLENVREVIESSWTLVNSFTSARVRVPMELAPLKDQSLTFPSWCPVAMVWVELLMSRAFMMEREKIYNRFAYESNPY